MSEVKVIVLRTAGTNCDNETKFAFEQAGAQAELVHINEIVRKEKHLSEYQILAIPGGFTYGDDIASGKILANELKYKFFPEVKKFIGDGKLIIGICNGFQVLVKAGILPGDGMSATLSLNDSAKFEDRWVYLKSQKAKGKSQKCVWTKGIPEIIYLPVAHGEGKFITKDKETLKKLYENSQVVLKYCSDSGKNTGYPDNPNGSVDNIAGICDQTGRIFGLMPHPERHILPTQHPRWTRDGLKKQGDDMQIFTNGVEYAKKYRV